MYWKVPTVLENKNMMTIKIILHMKYIGTGVYDWSAKGKAKPVFSLFLVIYCDKPDCKNCLLV